MDNRFEVAMITGHRPQHLSAAEQAWSQLAIAKTVNNLRQNYGTEIVVSGLALGADTWWALAGLSAGLKLDSYIPFKDQPKKWPAADQALWRQLVQHSWRKTVVGGQEFSVAMLHARNDAMLKTTLASNGLVVALFLGDKTSGGTFSAVDKAKKKGLPLLILDPAKETYSKVNWEA